jgi:hypothetical protein
MLVRKLLRSLVAAATLVFAFPADAQIFRAYLASDGSDANPCNLSSPCRLLPAALAAVADGGEIWMLDSANFNSATVNITKSVSILAVPGAVGSVIATAGPAFSIATAGVKVSLRNLVIGPFSSGATWGVLMLAGSELTVDGCVLANLPSGGINVNAIAKVRVLNTIVRNTGMGLFFGSGVTATVAHVNVAGSTTFGIQTAANAAATTTSVDINDSIVSGSGAAGIYSDATTAANGTVNTTVTRSTISQGLQQGVVSNGTIGTSNLVVGSSTIVSNATFGLVQSGGGAILTSFGNNIVRLNTSGTTSGTITTVPTL